MNEKTLQKRLKTSDGTIAHYMEGKMHNWDGPALIPEGDESRAEYYIYGVRYSKDDHASAKRDWNGMPWYKSGVADSRF
jgi:hypothetical protein